MKTLIAAFVFSAFSGVAVANHQPAPQSDFSEIGRFDDNLDRPGRGRGQVQCKARAARRSFVAFGQSRRQAARRAMQKCRSNARRPFTCHIVRCQGARHGGGHGGW